MNRRHAAAAIIALFAIVSGAGDCFALTLKEGLMAVTAQGLDPRIAREDEAAAQAGVGIARARLLPEVELYANQTWLRYQPEASPSPTMVIPTSEKDFLTYGLSARQVVYDFGRSYSGVKAASLGARAKGYMTTRARNTAARDFIMAYVSLLEADRMFAVAEEEVKLFEAHLSDAHSMYDEGVVTLNDTLEADVALSDARLRRILARDSREIKAARVNSLLLKPLSDPVVPEDIDKAPPEPMQNIEEAIRMAEDERQDVRAMRSRLESKQAQLNSIRAKFLPTLYVAGGYEYRENKYMVHDDNWSVVAGATMDIFSGGATLYSLRQARAELNSLDAEREKLIQSVRLDVREAYLNLQSAGERIAVTQKAVEQARENLRIGKLRYEEGDLTATDVLTAVALLVRAEQNYWSALYGTHKARAALLYATGGDLVEAYGRAEAPHQ